MKNVTGLGHLAPIIKTPCSVPCTVLLSHTFVHISLPPTLPIEGPAQMPLFPLFPVGGGLLWASSYSPYPSPSNGPAPAHLVL